MADLAPALVAIGMFIALGWIIKTIVTSRRMTKIVEIQADMHGRMLDKLGSAEEVQAYLESDAGEKLLAPAALERQGPYKRILGSIQAGLILSFVGLAIYMTKGQMDVDQQEFAFLGAIALALGLGFLVSAGAAFLLSKSWGLINGE